jgi:hypothetical protein
MTVAVKPKLLYKIEFWMELPKGSSKWVTMPGFAQMSKALRGNSSPEYRALLAAARSLEKDGMEVRFLFYYDN